jgi:hypothetical protein
LEGGAAHRRVTNAYVSGFDSHAWYTRMSWRVALNLSDRFWAKVEESGPDQCWEWLGHKAGLEVNGVRVKASRVSYMLEYGDVPPGCDVVRSCGNTRCVNPYHLQAWRDGERAELSKQRRAAEAVGRRDRMRQEREEAAPNLGERLWSRVARGSDDECWPWQGPRLPKGYGTLSYLGQSVLTHRAAYQVANGVDLGEHWVLHMCDNPPCCNPRHLVLGDNAENVRHRVERGRQQRGFRGPGAKLTEEQVREIRADPRPQTQIARDYGVDQSTVSYVKTRRKYADVA